MTPPLHPLAVGGTELPSAPRGRTWPSRRPWATKGRTGTRRARAGGGVRSEGSGGSRVRECQLDPIDPSARRSRGSNLRLLLGGCIRRQVQGSRDLRIGVDPRRLPAAL